MQQQRRQVDQMKILSRIKKVIPSAGKLASLVSREFGHWYMNGSAYGKQITALALGNIFRCSDRELPDELESRGLLSPLGYKNPPDHSIFSKVRKEIGEEKLGMVSELIIHEIYRDRLISLVAIDSSFIPYYFEDDADAAYGYVTLTKKEQEMLKEKTRRGIKKGYKLHLIYDVETGIPLYWVVLPANVNDKVVFKTLFDYVKARFKFAHDAKLLADSAYDSADIRAVLWENRLTAVIAINGRGHCKSSRPKDADYKRRGAIERFFSLLKMKLHLLDVRFKGIQSVTAHVSAVILGYLLKYVL